MKLLILLISLSNACLAQKERYTLVDMPFVVDSTTGGIVYREVVDVSGATSDQLYTRAKAFLLKTFTSDAPIVQVDDKATGTLTARGRYAVSLGSVLTAMNNMQSMYYEMPIEIRVKDGRYRYEVANIDLVNGRTRYNLDKEFKKSPHYYDNMSKSQYERRLSKDPILDLIKQLKTAMSSSSKDF